MKLKEALKFLKESGLESDDMFMLGVMYDDDLFSFVELTYEEDEKGDWWVAHLAESYLNSFSGEEVFFSGESDDNLLKEAAACFNGNSKLKKLIEINYKIYCLGKYVMDLNPEYALCALFPNLPNTLVSDEVIPNEGDIAKFRRMAKEAIDLVNKED